MLRTTFHVNINNLVAIHNCVALYMLPLTVSDTTALVQVSQVEANVGTFLRGTRNLSRATTPTESTTQCTLLLRAFQLLLVSPPQRHWQPASWRDPHFASGSRSSRSFA